ncbi:G protein-coupled receptor gpr1 [Purpureocillium takamizusanense]|uniref:G protein-coupled receptor gpr1 n=1 Tax=Purpureocillium takamizusanense TaxID=2060973 RepID=A0A9Q8V9H8_9HYPO|nr:G protein-coupled receptor gpr1 [Purpureocillium takamizusanense]UNI16802.1 G protein-coupled receptor gpr1 [Purpureocillium takamizusanense]
MGQHVGDYGASAAWLAAAGSPPVRRHHQQRDYSEAQLQAFRVTSVTVASLSVVATMLTTFWFLRMRRSFRHDLIILLIQSDMLKSLWFVIFAAAELTHGTVETATPFCQISGFFLTLGIEACDVAVILFALHKTMYIFRGGSGLYSYKRVAYAAFILIPFLLASLAFINKPAFANEGPYCYLPTKPRWTRRVLSWIPRTTVLVGILAMYLSTYVYFKLILGRFAKTGTAGRRRGVVRARQEAEASPRPQTTMSIPPTPPIAYHGLIPPTPSCDGESVAKDRRPSIWTVVGIPPLYAGSSVSISQDSIRRDASSEISTPYQARSRSFSNPYFSQFPSVLELPSLRGNVSSTAQPAHPATPSSPAAAVRSIWGRPLTRTTAMTGGSRASSPSNDMSMLNLGSRGADSMTGIVVGGPTTLGVTSTAQARDKIRRSLRQLFIYPAVYTAVWIVPYVSFLMGADRRKAPFGMVMASVTSMCLQGVADALVFCVMEKPWRHPRRADAPASSCWILRRLAGATAGAPGAYVYGPEGSSAAKVGRTREEMLVDSRIARRRRDEELAERRLQRCAAVRPARREWWDTPLRDCQWGEGGGGAK